MDQSPLKFHSFYRIINIEYTATGHCMVGVQAANAQAPQIFNLSEHCYQYRWLKQFHQPDLETIWQLAKQQRTISRLKRMLTCSLVKGLVIRDMLMDWEEEAKKYMPGMGRDLDDW